MNRYPVWKYIVIVVVVLLGALYTAPNYFGESPALQITSGKSTVKVDSAVAARVEQLLGEAKLGHTGVEFDAGASHSVRARFGDTDTQFKAKLALERGLNADPNDPTYIVTNNLQANTPDWMRKLGANPMFRGLDLRGGVHFLMQVDTKAALDKRIQGFQAAIRGELRDKNVRHAGIDR
ncbi:MAG TPA: protein translocase subunit SecD, partial [Pseudoduganella sp.]